MPVLGGYAITVNWGAAAGVFSKITGIKSDTAVLDQNVSSEKGSPKILKIPGKYGCYPVTLSAGYMEQLQAEGPMVGRPQEDPGGRDRLDPGRLHDHLLGHRPRSRSSSWSSRTPGHPSGAPATCRSRRASCGSKRSSSSASP